MKIPLWKKNVLSRNFNDFLLLYQFKKESKREFQDVFTEDNLSTLFVGHLNLLGDNLTAYFPEDNDKRLEANLGIMQPFNDEPTKDKIHYGNTGLIEIKKVCSRKWITQSFKFLFWSFPNIKISQKRPLLSLYRCLQLISAKKAFPFLLRSSQTKRNSILDIDCSVRGGIKKGLTPHYGHIAKPMQKQASH